MNDTIKRLEALRQQLQATRDTEFSHPGAFTAGITAGLRLALLAVDDEIQSVRNFEAALAAHQ